MKKGLLLILSLLMCLSLSACGSQPSAYQNLIDQLDAKNYDAAIQLIEQMKEEAIKEANANKGIQEITITSENWSEYFEFGYSYDYYMNSFDEIEYINCTSGFKLKDGYDIVMDDVNCETNVAFEAVLEYYDANVTYDFEAGTFEVGEEIDAGVLPYTDYHTTTYTQLENEVGSKEVPADGTAGMGGIWQGSADEGSIQEDRVTRIVDVLRAEGTLYIYQ